MGIIGKILVTVLCILLSIYSFRLGKRKQKYESDVNTIEIEKRHNTRIIGHTFGFIFLLPLISCWFHEWAQAHNWHLCYAIFLSFVFIFFVICKIKDDEDREEVKKRSNIHHDYTLVD